MMMKKVGKKQISKGKQYKKAYIQKPAQEKKFQRNIIKKQTNE